MSLNYKHLRYFWAVAKAGSIGRASERLHLAPQSISGQLHVLEEALGLKLFRRSGRHLELTDMGRLVLSYADEIFTLGEELEEVLRTQPANRPSQLKVGIADVVPKTIAYRLLEPAVKLEQKPQLICREGRLDDLLADLAVHRLDLVIADRPMPPALSVRGFNHMLGECGLSFFATRTLTQELEGVFPQCLHNAPMLFPGEDSSLRARLIQWLDSQRIRPRIAGEFDDVALLRAFGEAGTGLFAVPSVLAAELAQQSKLVCLGETSEISEQFFAITVERRLTHPAVVAVFNEAREALFGPISPSSVTSSL